MAWPLNAAVLGNNYGFRDEQPVVRTPMEQGPERKVRISNQYSTMVSIEFLLTATELNTFRTYYIGSECEMGAGWFDMDIITTEGLATHEVRIEDEQVSKVSAEPDRWLLRLTIETREHIA